MLFRLTVLLLGGLYLAMRFAPDLPLESQIAQRLAAVEQAATAAPDTPATAEPPAPEIDPPQQDARTAREAPAPAAPAGPLTGEEDVAQDAEPPSGDEALSPSALPGLDLGGLGDGGVGAALSLSDAVRERAAQREGGAEREPAEAEPPAPDPAARQPRATGPQAQTAMVVATNVNLRGGPSTADPVVGRVNFGDRVEFLDEPAPGWARIRHPDTGEAVFMARRFLQPEGG